MGYTETGYVTYNPKTKKISETCQVKIIENDTDNYKYKYTQNTIDVLNSDEQSEFVIPEFPEPEPITSKLIPLTCKENLRSSINKSQQSEKVCNFCIQTDELENQISEQTDNFEKSTPQHILEEFGLDFEISPDEVDQLLIVNTLLMKKFNSEFPFSTLYSPVPKSYKQALNSIESNEWRVAFEKIEKKSLVCTTNEYQNCILTCSY
jgi:hypothetical protein